jgi:hypothetical protein
MRQSFRAVKEIWNVHSSCFIEPDRSLTMLNGNQTDLARKEANLVAVVEKMLPEFARACRAHDTPVVIMHQDAFAADYQEEEYRLIGLAIKFAGICGKEVCIIGTNRQTIDESKATPLNAATEFLPRVECWTMQLLTN